MYIYIYEGRAILYIDKGGRRKYLKTYKNDSLLKVIEYLPQTQIF